MIMVEKGHVALAESVYNETFHLAWGKLPADYPSPWQLEDNPPAPDDAAEALLLEIGRRLSTVKSYAMEDANGDIVANGTKWSKTNTPTRHVYLQFKFDADDASEEIIRQLGIFIGTIPSAGNEQKHYLLPSDIETGGTLFMAENVKPIARNNATREMFEYIITF